MSKPRTKLPDRPPIQFDKDQTEAFLFVGNYIHDFAGVEMTIDRLIVSHFLMDHTIARTDRLEEVYDKNTSVLSILEHSVLSNRFFNVQMKNEILRAIMMERTPQLFIKHGKKFLDLLSRLQQIRNLLAHFQTNVLNKQIVIYKAKAEWEIDSPDPQKGGLIPEKTGAYLPVFKQTVVTEKIRKELMAQVGFVNSAIGLIALVKMEAFSK